MVTVIRGLRKFHMSLLPKVGETFLLPASPSHRQEVLENTLVIRQNDDFVWQCCGAVQREPGDQAKKMQEVMGKSFLS